MRRFLAPAACLLVFLTACASEPTAEAPVPAPDSVRTNAVLAVLDSLNISALRAAFADVNDTAHLRHIQTEQLAGDETLARRSYALRFAPGDTTPTVVQADSLGRFRFGFLSSFVSDQPKPPARLDGPDNILPEDPAYLDPRNRDAFIYSLAPDTLLWGTPTRVIDIYAAPDEGDDQAIRHARLYVDDAETLVAYRVERRNEALFFHEQSDLFVGIRPAADSSTWVPAELRIDTRLRVPFRGRQHFRTYTRYEIVG